MAIDGLRACGIENAGEWEVAQLDAALLSGSFGELVSALGGVDLGAALGGRWRGPKHSAKRPGWGAPP